jgi:hypothetical protein
MPTETQPETQAFPPFKPSRDSVLSEAVPSPQEASSKSPSQLNLGSSVQNFQEEEPCLGEVDRMLLAAEETAKRRRKSQENLSQNQSLPRSIPHSSHPEIHPQVSPNYQQSYQMRFPQSGQESTPIDDQRRQLGHPTFNQNSEPSGSLPTNSTEPSLEEVDRIFMEAVESSKRKRQSLQMNPPSVPHQNLSTPIISRTIPVKPIPQPSTPQYPSLPYQPQLKETEPSIEDVDRMLMEAEETIRRKRQSQGNGHPHPFISRSNTAPAPSTQFPQPSQQPKFPYPVQGSTTPIDQRNFTRPNPQPLRNGLLKQASDPDLNNSTLIRPTPAYSTPKHSSSSPAPTYRISAAPPLTVKENERPHVLSRASPFEKPNPYSKFEALKSNTSTPMTHSAPKVEITYDTISFEDFAAIEEMEQFALSQRNTEVFHFHSLSTTDIFLL